jgi:hypothetical protein
VVRAPGRVRAVQTLRRTMALSWPRRYPLVQFPNPPLLAALAGSVAARVLDGQAHDAADAVFYVGLSAWAYLELSDGANAFRRVFGAAGLVYVTVRLTGAL